MSIIGLLKQGRDEMLSHGDLLAGFNEFFDEHYGGRNSKNEHEADILEEAWATGVEFGLETIKKIFEKHGLDFTGFINSDV